MSYYTPTIRLELHAELKTKTRCGFARGTTADETRRNVTVSLFVSTPATRPVSTGKGQPGCCVRLARGIRAPPTTPSSKPQELLFYPTSPKGNHEPVRVPARARGKLAGGRQHSQYI